MAKSVINITLDRELWDRLSVFAYQQSILGKRRFPTIHALRFAIKTFLKMRPEEIKEILKREDP